MITVKITCPDHGDIDVDPDALMLAETLGVVVVACPTGHLFERPVGGHAMAVLSGLGVATVDRVFR